MHTPVRSGRWSSPGGEAVGVGGDVKDTDPDALSPGWGRVAVTGWGRCLGEDGRII